MKLKHLIIAMAATVAGASAHAGNSINLGNYQLSGSHKLDTLGGMGLEASAVTYAGDRGSLFFVGDEGKGVVEVSLTGTTLGTMTFSAWPSTTSHHDAEGLTYLGNNVLVVGEERLQDGFQFTYVANGSVSLASAQWASVSNHPYNNVGMEGISYDPRDGSFVSVKQATPMEVRSGTLSFAAGGGTSTMAPLFDANLLGLASLSDVQTLSPVSSLAGTAAADNLLILSLDSQRLVETNRSGTVLSSFDLSGITTQAIEGVTVDQFGRIYLVAEDTGQPNSMLFVLTPVPEPETYAMLLAGLGLMGFITRRHKTT
jgi:uncharacterized protein YjiK